MDVETPTAVAAGVILSLFGSALLLWCALELRLRHHLRAHGIPATARVVPDRDLGRAADRYPQHDPDDLDDLDDLDDEPVGDGFGPLDSAPLLRFTAHVPAAGVGRGELRVVEEETEQTVLARPRGRTLLRRPATLVPGTTVQVAYDVRRPSRVVLAPTDEPPSLQSDLFWALLGTGALAGGISLLTHVLAR
jgi:hypothetical protein